MFVLSHKNLHFLHGNVSKLNVILYFLGVRRHQFCEDLPWLMLGDGLGLRQPELGCALTLLCPLVPPLVGLVWPVPRIRG